MNLSLTNRRVSDLAKTLRASVATDGITITHTQALTHISHMLGFANTNSMMAALPKAKEKILKELPASENKAAPVQPPIPVIKKPKNDQAESPDLIRAHCRTDNRQYLINFDAVPYFEEATIKDVIDLAKTDWGGDYPADNVAWAVERLPGYELIHKMMEYDQENYRNSNGERGGFGVYVCASDALAWLKLNRQDVFEQIVAIMNMVDHLENLDHDYFYPGPYLRRRANFEDDLIAHNQKLKPEDAQAIIQEALDHGHDWDYKIHDDDMMETSVREAASKLNIEIKNADVTELMRKLAEKLQ